MHSGNGLRRHIEISDNSDRELLSRLKDGDSAAFWTLWECHAKAMQNICMRYLRHRPWDAEDGLSEAMLRAFNTLPRDAHRINNLRGWLARLTRNVCIDILRRDRKLEVGLDELDSVTEIRSEFQSSEYVFLKKELLQAIVKAIKELPDRLRLPLIARYLELHKYREIALSLGIQVPTTRKRIQHAKEYLKKKLGNSEFRETALDGDRSIFQTALHLASQDLPRPGPNYEISPATSLGPLLRMDASKRYQNVLTFLTARISFSDKNVRSLLSRIHRNPRGWKRRWELAQAYFCRREWQFSLSELEIVLQRRPDSLQPRFLYARLLEATGHSIEAISQWEQSAKHSRTGAGKLYCDAQRKLITQDLENAASLLKEAAKLEPRNPAHLQELARQYIRFGRTSLALRTAKQILHECPSDPVALPIARSAMIACGSFAGHTHFSSRIHQEYPEEPISLAANIHRLCREAASSGEYRQQIRALLKQLRRVTPNSILTVAAECTSLQLQDKNKMAAHLLAEFVKKSPEDIPARLYHVRMLARRGAMQLAATEISTIAKLDTAKPILLPETPWVLVCSGYRSLLEQILVAAHRQYPQHSEILSRIALARILLRKSPLRTESIARTAHKLDPDAAHIQLRLGAVLLYSRGLEAARASLETGLMDSPPDACGQDVLAAGLTLSRIYSACDEQSSAQERLWETLKAAKRLAEFDLHRSLKWQDHITHRQGKEKINGSNSSSRTRACELWFDGTEMDEFGEIY